MKTLDTLVEELMNHEAIRAADAAIVLQAIRTSTKGYDGPSFRDAVRATFLRFAREVVEECVPSEEWCASEAESNGALAARQHMIDKAKEILHD